MCRVQIISFFFFQNEHCLSQCSVSQRRGCAALQVVPVPPGEMGFALQSTWTAPLTMCRAVGGDPAKTPPLSSSSKLKTACNLIPSSPPSTKQSTGPLRTCCLCHSFLGRLRLSIQRPRVRSSPPTPRVNVSYLSLV